MLNKDLKIDLIKKKLDYEPLSNLDPLEICSYIYYRISKLIAKNRPLSMPYIRYRICELGPWRKRIDPLSLEIILTSSIFKSLSGYDIYNIDGVIFVCMPDLPTKPAKALEIKRSLLNKLQALTQSPLALEHIKALLINTSIRNKYQILDSSIIENKYIECSLKPSDQSVKNILLRYYNQDEWIYPYSSEIWACYCKAVNLNAIPIILAPKIFGSCFQLFKTLGMLGRSNYYIFIPKEIDNLTKDEEKELTNNPYSIYFRYEEIDNSTQDEIFLELQGLLTNILPVSTSIILKNQEKSIKTILPLLSTKLKELLSPSKNIEHRIDLLGQMLINKMLKGKNVREMINKWKTLYLILNETES